MKLDIILPRNRIYAGFFTLTTRHKHLLLAGRARGKADNGRAAREGNPSRSSLLPYGDAPLGRSDTDGNLVATHGCVRLDVIDFERLADTLNDDPVSVRITERWCE